jgi:chromosome segregation ATPase
MKSKIAIVALAVAIVALFIALFATRKQGEERHASDLTRIEDFSNQVVSVNLKVSDVNQVNLVLSNAVLTSQEQLAQLSNNLVAVNGTLAETKTSLQTAQQQVATLNTQVADLESQNKALDQRAAELTNAIAKLNALIAETQAKLALSQGNNAYLQAELQRQMAAKAELEHKFNDLEVVRAQVKKLKSDAFTARRLQWMKNDTSNKKGAELLVTPNRPSAAAAPAPDYGLNVEVGSDGSVRVIPPLGAPTNAPAK